jgi:hypothetical protein
MQFNEVVGVSKYIVIKNDLEHLSFDTKEKLKRINRTTNL